MDYYNIGVYINLSRRNVELVRQVTGGLLILYVAVIILTTMLAKDVLDKQTAYTIQTTLDLPTALTLVVFTALSLKLELDKPKYRQFQRDHGNLDMLLMGGGAALVAGLIYLKYFL